jgi:radical S-adenosyl methionine domain-containing protein 2
MPIADNAREEKNHAGCFADAKHQKVVNWHLTEACNYACGFCYAKWDKPSERELIHDGSRTRALLGQIHALFASSRAVASGVADGDYRPVRLNIAGGEPLLYRDKVLGVATYARSLGFEVSIITNGSLLDRSLLVQLAPMLSLLGISIDSTQAATNRAIGRADKRSGRTLGIDAVGALFRDASESNPELRFKINTVVNSRNWQEDMTSAIRRLAPEKWKVLQMLPVQNSDLTIGSAEFREFVERHAPVADIMSVEDNDSMTESYIMIDPLGRFYQNAEMSGGYRYSRPILQVGAREAFEEMRWSEHKFVSRYAKPLMARGVTEKKNAMTGGAARLDASIQPPVRASADRAYSAAQSRAAPRLVPVIQV